MIRIGLFLVALIVMPVAAESSMEKVGREMHEQILQETPIYSDKKVTEYVNAIGQRLVEANHSKTEKYQYTFTVIDDQTINAFALPGGYIYIHRGLLTYLNSEAQLAAVLAHEIGHVTENHHGRQKRAAVSNAVVAGVLGILTGSNEVAEASALWGQSVVSGFGRDMELEADETGAEYLISSGYDPQAMIEVISLLKDHERLEKLKARESGKKVQGYHGLFATHPRNDTRLQKAVGQAGTLKNTGGEMNVSEFRLATEGLVWGQNYAEVSVPENVYQNNQYAWRITIPKGWQFSEDGKLVVGKPDFSSEENKLPETLQNGRMEISVLPRTTESPDVYIRKRLKIPLLKKSEAINPNRLKGHMGVVPKKDHQPQHRLAVLYYSRYAFVLRGDLPEEKSGDLDDVYKQIIASFRPVSRRAVEGRQSKVIHYVKATSGTTFARLADYLKLGKYGEEDLRIINGYYPTGEAKPGEWIKIIQ